MGRVLALDLSSKTGWACGSLDPAPISHGVVRLPKTAEDIGKFLYAYREWLGHAIEEMAPSEIIYEMPILPQSMSLMAVRKLNGLCGITEVIAIDYKVPIREANLLDIRRHFIGVTRAPKDVDKDRRRQWMKATVAAKARERGFRVVSDDDADAIALLSFALSLYQPGFVLTQPATAAA